MTEARVSNHGKHRIELVSQLAIEVGKRFDTDDYCPLCQEHAHTHGHAYSCPLILDALAHGSRLKPEHQ